MRQGNILSWAAIILFAPVLQLLTSIWAKAVSPNIILKKS